MPELPEVEVTRRGFASSIAGACILELRLGKPLRWPLGCDPEVLVGQRLSSVGRRGKYLLLHLDQGCLLLHLGMSGSLRFAQQLPAAGPHDHMDLVTTQGILRLHDPRRFGAVVFVDDLQGQQAQKLLGRLGVEPLSQAFELETFHKGLKRRHSAIKTVLLSGDLVVGVGNIYACEALFLAGIRPSTRANRISRRRAAALHQAIQQVLANAIERGGSTLRDFSSADGQSGYFQLDAMVYGRAGLPCRACETPIRLIKQGQRSSFFCPTCQSS
jgi:formamidopyrimidine-DNA glycosylase